MYLLPYQDARELLDRHGIHAPVGHEQGRRSRIDCGTPIGIQAVRDENGQSFIALRAHHFGTMRMCPVSLSFAESMVDQLHLEGQVPLSPTLRVMLTNLLVRASKLFVEEALEQLSLDPVYVREHDYRIGRARMFSTKELHVHKRLAPDAHDRGAVFAYRPTARLK
jgi:hypothetical protein